MRLPTWLKTGLVLLVIAAGSYGLYTYLQQPPLPDQVIYGNGRIEATEVRVAPEVGGRVVANQIREGDTVTRGATLITLDDTELKLQTAAAEANVEAQRAERKRLDAELTIAQHHLASAQNDLDRARELEAKGSASTTEREQAENAFAEASGKVAALEAEIAAVDARIEASRRQVDLLADKLAKTDVKSPINGTVLTKAVESGELIQPGQVVAILADLSDMELKVYVPESDIGKVSLDAAARVAIDAFPERTFEARVARVDSQAQFTPRDIHMPSERVRTIFGVTLALDNPDGWLKPGMPADAWILWRPEAGWPERLFVPE